MVVWHRRVLRFDVLSEISKKTILRLFADPEFLAPCERVVAGFDERWNNDNLVGNYTEDAEAAFEELTDYIAQETYKEEN